MTGKGIDGDYNRITCAAVVSIGNGYRVSACRIHVNDVSVRGQRTPGERRRPHSQQSRFMFSPSHKEESGPKIHYRPWHPCEYEAVSFPMQGVALVTERITVTVVSTRKVLAVLPPGEPRIGIGRIGRGRKGYGVVFTNRSAAEPEVHRG